MAEETDTQKTPDDSGEGGSESSGGGGFLEKLKKAPPWVWIGIAIGAATLVVGYLAYQNNASVNPPGSVTPSTPNSSLPPGATNGPVTQQELQNLQQEINNLQNSHYGGGHIPHGGGHHKKH